MCDNFLYLLYALYSAHSGIIVGRPRPMNELWGSNRICGGREVYVESNEGGTRKQSTAMAAFFLVISIIYGQYNATFDEWTTLMMVRSLRKYIKYQQPNALGMSAKVYVVTFVYARNVNGPYVVIRCHANIMDDLRPRKTDQSGTSIIWAQLTISVYLFVAAAQQQQYQRQQQKECEEKRKCLLTVQNITSNRKVATYINDRSAAHRWVFGVCNSFYHHSLWQTKRMRRHRWRIDTTAERRNTTRLVHS